MGVAVGCFRKEIAVDFQIRLSFGLDVCHDRLAGCLADFLQSHSGIRLVVVGCRKVNFLPVDCFLGFRKVEIPIGLPFDV
jgi:hypothetical protein